MILPYRKSHGREAVELYQRTGRKAMPWQKSLLKDIMAIGRGGLWKHQNLAFPSRAGTGKQRLSSSGNFGDWKTASESAIPPTAFQRHTSRGKICVVC